MLGAVLLNWIRKQKTSIDIHENLSINSPLKCVLIFSVIYEFWLLSFRYVCIDLNNQRLDS